MNKRHEADQITPAKALRAAKMKSILATLTLLGASLAAQASDPPTWQVQSDYFGERNAIAQPRTTRGLALSEDETSVYTGLIQSPNTGSTSLRKVKSGVLAVAGTDHVIFGNGMPGGTGTFGQVGGQPGVHAGGGSGTFEAWRDVGNSPEAIDTDDRGNVYVALQSGVSGENQILILSSDLATQLGAILIPAPVGVAIHKSGNIYYLYTMSDSGLRRYDVTSVVAPTLDLTWNPAVFSGRNLVVDADGIVFVAGNNQLRRVSADGTTVTHAANVLNAADVAIFQDKIYVIKRQSPTQPIVVLNKADLTSGGPDIVVPALGGSRGTFPNSPPSTLPPTEGSTFRKRTTRVPLRDPILARSPSIPLPPRASIQLPVRSLAAFISTVSLFLRRYPMRSILKSPAPLTRPWEMIRANVGPT